MSSDYMTTVYQSIQNSSNEDLKALCSEVYYYHTNGVYPRNSKIVQLFTGASLLTGFDTGYTMSAIKSVIINELLKRYTAE